MIDRIVQFSIKWRLFVVLVAIALIGAGIYSATQLPIDAVPDVTTDQVQINTRAPAFTPLEIEQYVTIPVELAMSSLPRKQEIRSISKFGLSQVTVIFEDGTDLYWARQLILERLLEAQRDLPPDVSPELAPISTGLGEIYQFTVEDGKDGEHHYSLMDLRTLLDWTIKPQLRTVPGVIEVNSFGGLEKQYEVLIDPAKLVSYGIPLRDVFEALERNNSNAGGAYFEHRGEQQLIRGVGLITNMRDIENIVVTARNGVPVYVRNIAIVDIGSQIRQGAATKDGEGETVMGMAMLLKGENSRSVALAVGEKTQEIQRSLPPGVRIKTFLDRSDLVDQTIRTATRNLVEGGMFVMLVLFLFLLQFRAGLIVSSAIPLSMLCAIIGMRYFNISANLMSLGAIDFGLIVDAAVIIVENCVRRLAEARRVLGRRLTHEERLQLIGDGTLEVRRASQYGEIIIIAAYIPVVSLAGIEGKMFRPMAFTVILALSGALLLSLTLIPALCAMFLREPRHSSPHERNPIVDFFRRLWEHLESGRNRLLLAVPVTFFIVFLLLFTTFQSLRQAALIFTGIPFALTGGVLSLLVRHMTFSMSAGVGFIAVSGVAVLNGVVMLAFFNQLREQERNITEAVTEGALTRLRPVLMTAFVASLGFVPMAISTSAGAEVQRPLATVVIGGLVTSTVLTLLVLPALYRWAEERREKPELRMDT